MSDTFFVFLVLASVIAFAVHNFEELHGIENWMKSRPPQLARRYRKKAFLVATTILWVLYAGLSILVLFSSNFTVFIVFAIAFAAIVGNGLLHVLALPIFRRPPPGFWSAGLLILPLGGMLGWRIISSNALTPQQVSFVFLTGVVLQAPLAAAAIFVANALLEFDKEDN